MKQSQQLELLQQLEAAQQKIASMESSKFWKLRRAWFKLKNILTPLQEHTKVELGKHTLFVSNDMAWSYMSGHYYEKNLTKLLDFLIIKMNSPVFYDIGANNGYYTVRNTALTKQIHAFEPVSSVFALLKKNKKFNKLNNVYLHKCGVSNENKMCEIHLYNSSGNNSLIERNIPANHPCKYIGTEEIRVVKLDHYIKSKKLADPDIIKIDIEGAELFALQGAKETITRNNPLIVFEYSENTFSDAGYSINHVIEFFSEIQYILYGFSENTEELKLFDVNQENLADISNIVALPINHDMLQILKDSILLENV